MPCELGRIFRMAKRTSPRRWKVASLVLLLLIFATDALTPLGFADGTLYVMAILLAAMSLDRDFVLMLAAGTVLAIVIGGVLSPTGFDVHYVLVNRLVSAATVVLVTTMARSAIRYNRALVREHGLVTSAHHELQRAQRLARIGAHTARLGGWELDLATRTVSWSDEARRILEIPAGTRPSLEEALSCSGSHWGAALQRAVDACGRSGQSFDEIGELATRSGRLIWVRLVGEAVRGADGRIVQLQGALQDISELRQSKDALEQLQSETTLILNAVGEGIHGLDTEGRIVFANPAAARLLGWTCEEMLGQFAHELFHHHRPDGARYPVGECPIYKTLKDGVSRRGEGDTFFRFDGTAFLADFDCSPMKDASGAVIGAVVSFRDVTRQYALEDRLRQARRLESVGQLTGGIAHDFNNLLQVILGNAELLTEHLRDDPKACALAAMTREAAERGAELTHRLLAFARRQALDPRPTDICQLIGSMETLLLRALGEQTDIVIAACDDLWPALIDGAQLENALLNLCINSRDAMPEGGTIKIEMANVTFDDDTAPDADIAPGQYVMLSVSDTGMGMDSTTLARAFDPFFTTKGTAKGSGLGLSMVYGFVNQSKGHINIHSRPGTGTIVEIYLPRALSAAERAQKPVSAAVPEHGAERILVVEDDELVLAHVSNLLLQLGYRIVTARNGNEALQALAENDCDLLFTDVMMSGGMNGRELAAAARALCPNLPVLFTSGYAESTLVHEGRIGPEVNLINKPYRQQELAAKLRFVIENAERNAHLETAG